MVDADPVVPDAEDFEGRSAVRPAPNEWASRQDSFVSQPRVVSSGARCLARQIKLILGQSDQDQESPGKPVNPSNVLSGCAVGG